MANAIAYNQLIDHTLLAANASPTQIEQLCHEAVRYGFFAVCVNPAYVATAKSKLRHTAVKVCTVVGFPLGQTATKQKVYEAKTALADGADEIDMVINIPELVLRCACVTDEIRRVKKVCGKHTLKVICETALLTDEQIKQATLVAIDAGADFIKTSTGFSTRGATVQDIQLMHAAAQGRIAIKASGGIKTAADLKALVAAGASRIGTSRGVQIIEELKSDAERM